MKILLNTTPLGNAHAIRGIGMYTKLLQAGLVTLSDVELVENPPADVIHFPFFDLFASTLPIKKALPTVVTIHDVVPLLFPDQYPAGMRGKAKFLKQKLALNTVSAVITDSYASKWDIVEYLNVPAEKIHVIYLAANPELKPASQAKILTIRQRYNLPKKYVLYVGDINYNKNLPQLIKAIKFLPAETQLVCVGRNFYPHPIPEWEAIDRQIALSDVSSQVTFITDLAGEALDDLAALYSGATCYVQPSLAEGFGLPVLEAMACGAPVVAAATSSLVEVGGAMVTYCGTQAESIAQAIEMVTGWSKTDRQARAAAAQAWAARFSWQTASRQTADVYQAVLASKS